MKPHVRVLGIDDSPFKFDDEKVVAVGVVVRAPSYIEGVMKTEVEVDGKDATENLAAMINASRHKANLALVMLDGVALGGFNVVDIEELHTRTGVPVVTVTRKEPDMRAMATALKSRFQDWEWRLEIVNRSRLIKIRTKHKPLFVHCVGMSVEEVREIIARTTVRGALPEPLRIAHLIATAIKRGESYSRA